MDAQSSPPKPTVNRNVIFNADNGEKHAAIIAYVWNDELVNLACFDRNGVAYNRTSVQLGDGPGRWNWPTRV